MIDIIIDWISALQSSPLLGHLLTFLGSLFTTALFFVKYTANVRAEVRRLRLEAHNQYALELLRKRLDHYAECYRSVSEFMKVVDGFRESAKPVEVRPAIAALGTALNDWDSKYALLLSSDAGRKLYQLRATLRQAVKDLPADGELSRDAIGEASAKVTALELALKTDVGVYAVDEYLRASSPRSYADLNART